jgi:hypothetical protein
MCLRCLSKEERMPQTKVVAGGAAGALSVLVVYVAGLFGLDVPAEAASALTVLISSGAAYLKA